MKIQSFLMRTSLLFLFALLAFSGVRLAAQTQGDNAGATRTMAPAVPARITQAIDETQLVTLKGNVHPLARPEFDQGPVSDTQPMKRMMLILQRSPEQQAALQQLMAEQMSKDSQDFHKWLTPQQFGQQFGPADADVQTLTDWLTRQGFQGIKVAKGRTVIEFSGNAAQVRNAFHTEVHHFVLSGEDRSANVNDPQIPIALAPVIKGIVSLHNFPRKSLRQEGGILSISRNSRGVPQFSTTTGCPLPNGTQPCYFVGPADFAKIYNIPASLSGSGVTIGIVGDSNIDPQDVVNFRTIFSLTPTTGPNIIVDGPDPGIGGAGSDESEADLDVQISGMVAPKATIDFVVAQSTFTAQGTDLAALHIIDENLADVMSESFGICEPGLGSGGIGFFEALWEEAAAQGITVMVSAGDNGSAACDNFDTQSVATRGLAVNGIASTQFNIAVGGTDFDDVGAQTSFWNAAPQNGTIAESAKGYIHERTWNNSCAATATSANLNTVCANAAGILAGSGGPSSVANSKPSWQNGLTPADGVRDLPDVSLFSSVGSLSNSFYPVCEADAAGGQPSCSGNQFVVGITGGTSASSPAFAGIMALINQQQQGRQGNANFVLYKIAAMTGQTCNSSTEALSGSTCTFNDVTMGNNSVPCAGDPTKTLNCSSSVANANGVLVDPKNPTTPAWPTKTGYDYATGLGSVNVTNLAAAWPTAVGTFKGSTSSLTLNGGTTTNPIPHGTKVTATATVVAKSPATGTPTRDVSLVGPAGSINSGINAATLTGGSPDIADLTTTTLPGGSYSVTAHYAGDGTFGPSDSNAVPVVVSKENSGLQYQILLIDPGTRKVTNTNATSYVYGSSFSILRMDILNSTGNGTNCQLLIATPVTAGCAFDATGSVSINDNGGPLAGSPFNINSAGSAEDQTLQLTGGTHALSATYSGDVSYNATPTGSPVTSTVTVMPAPTTTVLTVSSMNGIVNSQLNLTADVKTSSTGVAPSCFQIVFKDGATVVPSGGDCIPTAGSVNGPAETVFAGATIPTTPGTHSYTATYTADANYLTSVSSAQSVVVKLGSNLGVQATPSQIVTGQSTTLAGQVSTGNQSPTPGPTGTVTFTGSVTGQIKSPATCMATVLSGNEGCQATVSYSPASSETVTATYSGDTNYAPDTFSPPISIVVTQPSFSLAASSTMVTAGGSGSSTITVTPTVGFTGMVAVTCPSLPPGVTCSPLNINVPGGSAVMGTLMVNVTGPSPMMMASTAPTSQVLSAGNVLPDDSARGWWTFSEGTGLAALVLLFLPGRKRYRAALRLGLICVLSFTLGCGGGSSGAGVTPPVTTTTQVVVSSTKVASTAMITISANVSGGSPAGNVQFFVDGAAMPGSSQLTNGSTGQIILPALTLFSSIGTHTLSAHYPGSATTTASQSGSLNVTLTGTTQLSISANPAPVSGGQTISLTIN